jgi:hypothetical protein
LLTQSEPANPATTYRSPSNVTTATGVVLTRPVRRPLIDSRCWAGGPMPRASSQRLSGLIRASHRGARRVGDTPRCYRDISRASMPVRRPRWTPRYPGAER